jgi:hypothetical protein
MKFSLEAILPGRAKRATPTKAKGGVAPDRRDILSLRPIRNPLIKWEEMEGQVVLTIQREKTLATGWKSRLAGMFINVPNNRTVELDAIGTDVWLMLDGQNTIDIIVKALIKKHKLSRRETELSLQEYFKELNRRGYIAFLTDTPELAGKTVLTKEATVKGVPQAEEPQAVEKTDTP